MGTSIGPARSGIYVFEYESDHPDWVEMVRLYEVPDTVRWAGHTPRGLAAAETVDRRGASTWTVRESYAFLGGLSGDEKLRLRATGFTQTGFGHLRTSPLLPAFCDVAALQPEALRRLTSVWESHQRHQAAAIVSGARIEEEVLLLVEDWRTHRRWIGVAAALAIDSPRVMFVSADGRRAVISTTRPGAYRALFAAIETGGPTRDGDDADLMMVAVGIFDRSQPDRKKRFTAGVSAARKMTALSDS